MELKYKPDFDRAQIYWEAFWNHEIIDRPVVCVTSPMYNVPPKPAIPYMEGYEGNYVNALSKFEDWASTHYFGGEAIPFCDLSFGPDQFTAFLGAELEMAETRVTSWIKPFVNEWDSISLKLDTLPQSRWNQMLEFMRTGAEFSQGKFLLGMLDLHSNMDALNAMRAPEDLCMDLINNPDQIDRIMHEVRALYAPIYENLYQAGQMQRGTIGWSPLYCAGRSAVIQCDFICLIGPKHARRFIIPAIAEEAAFLDHCVYHFDGPNALVHLEDILSIPEIDVIQWVPGDGRARTPEWMDLLKKIQKARKGLWLYDWKIEEIKQLYKELKPEGICFQLDASSPTEADELVNWLKANT